MATGRNNKLVGQTGEYLVAAELSRRGMIATTFTGNVPHYDIIASDETGKHISVQVKASRGSSWQLGDIRRFCNITSDNGRQVVGQKEPCPVQRLIVVFVKIGKAGDDSFYILPWEQLCDMLVEQYSSFLQKHNGIRPKRSDSYHCAIEEKTLKPFKDQWDFIEKNLK